MGTFNGFCERDLFHQRVFSTIRKKTGMAQKLRDKATNIPMLLAAALHSNGKVSAADAKTALVETETLLIICKHLDIITPSTHEGLQENIQQLSGQLSALSQRIDKQ